MMNVKWLLIVLLILTGCESKARECQDEETLKVAKTILWQNVQKELKDNAQHLDEQHFVSSIVIEHARPTSYEETIKKYSCAGTVRYLALGIPEFGATIKESGSSFTTLKKMRKEAVKEPLRYSALSLLTDNPYILSELVQNSDVTGYEFDTVFTSQKVGDEDLVSIAFSPANLQAMFVAAGIQVTNEATNDTSDSAAAIVPEEAGYVLSGREKGIVAQAYSNFDKTFKAAGVQGVVAERDNCYQAAAGIKDSTLTLQCIAYDYSASAIITAIETSKDFPTTPGFLESDVRIRALESVENTISDDLSTSKLRDTFLKSIKMEVDDQIAHETKKLP